MVCRQILLGALLLLGSASASAEAVDPPGLIEKLEQRIALDEQVSGTFEQKKFITVLPEPLRSQGRFSYHREDGLVWETLTPIPNRLVFDQQGIHQSVEGKTVWEVDAQQPAVVTITRVISSVLAADWQGLQDYFALDGQMDAQGWQLQLTPRDDVLEQIVGSIFITGDRVLSRMVLMEPNGDRTEISFSVNSAPS